MSTAGRLKHRVRFQRRGLAQDRYGTMLDDYGDLIPAIPAGITELRGGETIIASRLTGTRVVSLSVRATDATRMLKTSDRAVNARTGEVYDIKAIEGVETNARWLTILAESGASEMDLDQGPPNGTVWALEGGVWNDQGLWDDARVWRAN